MADREKVIKALECCILRDPDDHARCSQCSYGGNCVNRLKMDALELLKAQEMGEESKCPVTCSQYRDGWNDAMNFIFRNGDGYRPYDRIRKGR